MPGTEADHEVWDLVVIGAGPSGSSAALTASQHGASTLLLDSSDFPRYKTCGGGLIGISRSLIENSDELPVKDVITRLSFTLQGGKERRRATRSPVMKMVSREDLDLHLVNQAVKAGVTFRPRSKVTKIEESADGLIRIHTAGACTTARAVVGADGASGRSARHVGVSYAVTDVGLEYELEAGDQAARWRGRVHLDWGPIPGSYGWVFPKGDTLTVGVISERGRPDDTRAYLNSLVAGLGLAELRVLRSSGHLTRCRTNDSPLSRGRVLVAGDAAGLLEPWTREGISFAMRSGRLAGVRAAQMSRAATPHDVRSAAEDYAADIGGDLAREMRAGAMSRNAFAAYPGFFHFLIGRTALGWKQFCRISNGDTTLGHTFRHRTVRQAVALLQVLNRRHGQISLGHDQSAPSRAVD